MKVVINAQHKVLPEQAALLGEGIEIVAIPAEGIDTERQLALADELSAGPEPVAFVSPVPVLLAKTAALSAARLLSGVPGAAVFVMSNDRREAVEIDGRIIHRLQPEGWRLVEIV